MQVFIAICLLLIAVPIILFAIIAPYKLWAFVTQEWWTSIAFGCGIVAMFQFGWFAICQAFGVITIVATKHELKVVRGLGLIVTKRSIAAHRIKRFAQIKDGGQQGMCDIEPDSFPSWALVAQGSKRLLLLARQPLEKSDWLGAELSEWFGVPYVGAESRE